MDGFSGFRLIKLWQSTLVSVKLKELPPIHPIPSNGEDFEKKGEEGFQ